MIEGKTLSKKKVLIIPGSLSYDSNWLDQIIYFQELGYDVSYMKLEAERYPNLDICSNALFIKIRDYMQEIAYEKDAQSPIILCHSMGGMLLLRILSNYEYYSNLDIETFEAILQSQKYFIQAPIKRSNLVMAMLDISKWFTMPIMFFYSRLLFGFVDKGLRAIKKASLKLNNGIIDLIVNFLIIQNGCFGTGVKEYWNLIEYYRSWDLLSIFQGINLDNKNMAALFVNSHFSTADGDLFCNPENTHKLLKPVFEVQDKENYVHHFKNGSHIPMHLFWCQKEFHSWIMKNEFLNDPRFSFYKPKSLDTTSQMN